MEASRLLALCSLLLALAQAVSADVSAYGQLVKAIFEADQNARACKGAFGCLGTVVSVTLTTDVPIVAPLPPLQFNAYLEVVGACKKASRDPRCVIDGQQRQMFTSTPVGGPTAKLVLKNLRFHNANRGVLVNFWGEIQATQCVFFKNHRSVELSLGAEGGYPGRTFESCSFANNTGTAITSGHYEDGTVGTNVGYSIKACTFIGNVGDTKRVNGGAIALYGKGTATIAGSLFSGNLAYGSGGAIYLGSYKKAIVKSSQFKGNKAMFGQGGAIGARAMVSSSDLSLCSCTFSRNAAPARGRSTALLLYGSYHPGILKAAMCKTPVPKTSDVRTAKISQSCAAC